MPKSFINMFRGDLTPSEINIKEEPLTPNIDNFGEFDDFTNSLGENYGEMRRSLSTNDIASLKEELMNLRIKDERKSGYYRQTGSSQDLSRTKFVSMAEAVYHYQRDTPGRFHSKAPTTFHAKLTNGPSGVTIPQSPMLRCKARSRPVHVMSQKEKEELELENIRKFKIKANPIPKSVIEGPINLPEVSKKPATVPEPFKLTEIPRKIVNTDVEVHKFKARPAPKYILDKPQLPEKKPVTVTIPISPNFRIKPSNHVPSKNELDKKTSNSTEKLVRLHPVKPEPFSFEKRDEELRRRKEEKIRREIEEQRKQASQFKAQPLPIAVKKRMKATVGKENSSTASSENKENNIKFEAKPPSVLYKEPFKPVIQHTNIKLAPFKLTTEKRALEREKFDHKLKEKEEEMEKLRLQREKEIKEAEERARSELRAKLVHHAKPPPAISPFIPVKSDEPLTIPETPKFIRRIKQH